MIIKETASPTTSAIAPTSGNINIIKIEKNILFTESSVARFSDGIRRLSVSDCIRYSAELKKSETSSAPNAI